MLHASLTVLPQVIHAVLLAGLRVLIYSGDHDMCVPHTGSEAWTRALGLKKQEHWRPWKVSDQVCNCVPYISCCAYRKCAVASSISDHKNVQAP